MVTLRDISSDVYFPNALPLSSKVFRSLTSCTSTPYRSWVNRLYWNHFISLDHMLFPILYKKRKEIVLGLSQFDVDLQVVKNSFLTLEEVLAMTISTLHPGWRNVRKKVFKRHSSKTENRFVFRKSRCIERTRGVGEQTLLSQTMISFNYSHPYFHFFPP